MRKALTDARTMRNALWTMVAALLLVIPSAGRAQRYQAGAELDGCLRQFYDAEHRGWLSLENVCGEAIQVVFASRIPGHAGGSATIRPGQKHNTGYSRSEMDQRGGFTYAICRAGYVPVDASGRYWTQSGTSYRCKSE